MQRMLDRLDETGGRRMSYNCEGCHYDSKLENGQSFCDYYRKTKHDMDRERGIKYLSFRHGKCNHDTRKDLND